MFDLECADFVLVGVSARRDDGEQQRCKRNGMSLMAPCRMSREQRGRLIDRSRCDVSRQVERAARLAADARSGSRSRDGRAVPPSAWRIEAAARACSPADRLRSRCEQAPARHMRARVVASRRRRRAAVRTRQADRCTRAGERNMAGYREGAEQRLQRDRISRDEGGEPAQGVAVHADGR